MKEILTEEHEARVDGFSVFSPRKRCSEAEKKKGIHEWVF
jgi:hypothetical protein